MGLGDDAAPCRHEFPTALVDVAIDLLQNLPASSPQLLAGAQIAATDWQPLLRAAIERLRGQSAATTSGKYRFIEAVLRFGVEAGAWRTWLRVGTDGRNDFRVEMNDGALVSIEAKGCPDGNNTGIWDRPGWADEFIVWSQCSESLTKHPGAGIWSGIATRIAMKTVAEGDVVDAFIFWDGRCGSDRRRCSKDFGVDGGIRSEATDIIGQSGRANWLPPPCVYLLPKNAPRVQNNRRPPVHTVNTLRFAKAILQLFGVPEGSLVDYVHDASYSVRNVEQGTQVQVTLRSRNWPDSQERTVTSKWKDVRRE